MLAEVSTYSTLDNQVLLGVNSLNIAADTPPVSGGLYYLIKPLGCGSWQTVVGAEPGRDSSLP